MLTATDLLAHSLDKSKSILLLYIDDLTPQEYLHRPATPEKVNCVAWLLGHLILTDRWILKSMLHVPADDLPALPEGFERRFSRDEGCPQAGEFGDVSILAPLFGQYRDRLIETLKGRPIESLEVPLEKPHPRFKTPWEAINFMAIHTAMHAGQITVIRRSLGRKPLF